MAIEPRRTRTQTQTQTQIKAVVILAGKKINSSIVLYYNKRMLKEPTVLFVRVVPDEYVDADVLIFLRYIQNYLFLGDLLFFLEDFGSPKQSKITSVRVDPLD